MESMKKAGFHQILRAFILGGFAAYIVYLVRNDALIYYIAPRMQLYVKLSAMALYVIAAYQLYSGIRALFEQHDRSCGCGHNEPPPSSPMKTTVLYSLFLFPLLLGFALPDALLDSTLANKRGVNLSKGEMQRSGQSIVQTNSLSERMRQQETLTIEEPAKPNGTSSLGVQDSMSSSPLADGAAWDEKLKEMFVADEFYEDFAKLGMKLYKQDIISVPEEGFIETITAIDIFKDLFVGKTAELSGFVYRDESMKRNQFAVTRFEVQCCSADASAFGIMVELDEAPKYKTDDWVKVTGIIGKSKYEDNDIVKLDATKIEPIPAPASPYVYPDYQFLFKP